MYLRNIYITLLFVNTSVAAFLVPSYSETTKHRDRWDRSERLEACHFEEASRRLLQLYQTDSGTELTRDPSSPEAASSSFDEPKSSPVASRELLIEGQGGFSYVAFAQDYPLANNLLIATTKTVAADLLAQTVIAQTPLSELDLQRSLLFSMFGFLYLGGFQYLYQVQIFKRLFDVDKFTSQSLEEKAKDVQGLQALAGQTILDLTVLTLIYLPTFYVFKACVFTGGSDPSVWLSSGLDSYTTNFAKDEVDLIKVWLPADLVCFSVPMYLRLPVRHIVSFVWTAYLSFARGGH